MVKALVVTTALFSIYSFVFLNKGIAQEQKLNKTEKSKNNSMYVDTVVFRDTQTKEWKKKTIRFPKKGTIINIKPVNNKNNKIEECYFFSNDSDDYEPDIKEWSKFSNFTKSAIITYIANHDTVSIEVDTIHNYNFKKKKWKISIVKTQGIESGESIINKPFYQKDVIQKNNSTYMDTVDGFNEKTNEWSKKVIIHNKNETTISIKSINNPDSMIIKKVFQYDGKTKEWTVEVRKTRIKSALITYATGNKIELMEVDTIYQYNSFIQQWEIERIDKAYK